MLSLAVRCYIAKNTIVSFTKYSLHFSQEILRITQPILLGLLIDYFVLESKVERSQAFIYAGLVSLNTICLALVHGPYYWQIMRLGMHIRVALGTAVYHKVRRTGDESVWSSLYVFSSCETIKIQIS